MSHGAGEVEGVRYLLENLPVMYALTRIEDGEPVIADCNRRFVETLGYDRGELFGRPLADVYTPESADRLRSGGYERALRDEFTSESRTLVRADGTVVYTLLRAVPWTASDGETVGTRALFVDITDREKRRQQADILNRLLRHNLRNDMTVILGHASILVEELDDEETTASAEQILDTARRWQHLVEKVQRIRKVLASNHDWNRTDLSTALERIETDIASSHPDATVRILRPPEGTATIRPEIELALTELCENAIRHGAATDPEVVVTASTSEDDTWTELTVADTGPAIPDSELIPLRDAETTPLLHGTGIGLWMVRLAAQQVGGEVLVRENDDQGTVITIRYPCG